MEKQEVSLTLGQHQPKTDYFVFKEEGYGERHFVRNGDHQFKEVTNQKIQPVRVHADRVYAMKDVESFVIAVTKYGDATKGVVFYNTDSIVAYLDETSRKEQVRYALAKSLELRSFLDNDGKGKKFNQKEFFKLLETFPECVENVALIGPKVERFALATNVEVLSDINPDNITFSYKEKTGIQTEKLPKKLTLNLPYFERSQNRLTIICDLEVVRPKDETQKPTFTLSDPKAERTGRDALDRELGNLKLQLKDWTFVHGSAV